MIERDNRTGGGFEMQINRWENSEQYEEQIRAGWMK